MVLRPRWLLLAFEGALLAGCDSENAYKNMNSRTQANVDGGGRLSQKMRLKVIRHGGASRRKGSRRAEIGVMPRLLQRSPSHPTAQGTPPWTTMALCEMSLRLMGYGSPLPSLKILQLMSHRCSRPYSSMVWLNAYTRRVWLIACSSFYQAPLPVCP